MKPLMNFLKIKFKKTNKHAVAPTYAKEGDCGCDLYAIEDTTIIPGQRQLIDTGIAIELPSGFEAQIRPRSGSAWKHGVTVLNAPGTIDCGYRNSIRVILINHGKEPFTVKRGMRIAQMVVERYTHVNWIVASQLEDNDERGEGGFGSTGTD